MPRFFFHLRSGHRQVVDLEGSELPDVAAARTDALAAARQILGERVRDGKTLEEQVFEITDAEGRLLETVAMEVIVRVR